MSERKSETTEIDAAIQAILRTDGDRDWSNSSNLPVEVTLAIADLLKRLPKKTEGSKATGPCHCIGDVVNVGGTEAPGLGDDMERWETWARVAAHKLPPSDLGSTRAIQLVARLLRQAYRAGASEKDVING